jgi:hypothetical protein
MQLYCSCKSVGGFGQQSTSYSAGIQKTPDPAVLWLSTLLAKGEKEKVEYRPLICQSLTEILFILTIIHGHLYPPGATSFQGGLEM